MRSKDREKVLATAEQVAIAMGMRMLVGPALKGWIGIYPEYNGRDETVREQIAAIVPGYFLHVMVHDDDILAYSRYYGWKALPDTAEAINPRLSAASPVDSAS